MSKKKLLAGKKTKLAKLALTQALAGKSPGAPEPAAAPETASPSLTQVVQAMREWQSVLDQPLTAIPGKAVARKFPRAEYSYFHLLQDLRHLQELLPCPGLPATPKKARSGRLVLPSPEIFKELIRLTIITLRELKSLLD